MSEEAKTTKKSIQICLGSSCFSRGNKANLEAIKQYLSTNGLSASITFSGRLCENMCDRGPIVVVDGKIYEEVNLSRLIKILQEEFPC